MKRATVAAVATALALPALATATTSGPASAGQAPTAERPRPYVSSGKVVDRTNGRALKGVRVVVLDLQYDKVLGRDRTNDRGRWRIPGLTESEAPDGEIGIKFNDRRGYVPGCFGVNPDDFEELWVVPCADRASGSARDIGTISMKRS